ncbi:phosphoinositide phosphatase SAC2-like protein isoform X2, partial [Tanacetum coccineum]
KLCSDLLEHMDKSWMNIVHRLSDPRYELGVMKFLDFAYRDKDRSLEIPCPCKICHNFRPQKKDVVYSHLMQKGISLDYIRWTEHGETSTSHSEDYVDDGEDDTLIDESDDMSDDDLDDMLDNIGQSTWGDGWKTSGKSEFIMQIFSQRRGQWKAASQSQEFFRTLQRYYSNAYMDAQKQDAINVFLGHYQPQVGKPALWELDSDQHQNVGSRGSNFIEKNTRGSYQRSLSDGNFTSSAIDIGQNEEIEWEQRYVLITSSHGNLLLLLAHYIALRLYAHSMPRRQLFVDTHSDDYPNSDRIFYNKRLDSFNCSNFLDVDWISSSGNSCEDEPYERLTCSPFGCQAKELLVHLENVLSNEPALVKRGRHIVEVKPQGLHKILASAHDISRSTVDFFNNLSHRATKLMAVLEENHKTSSQELAAFEKNFKVKLINYAILDLYPYNYDQVPKIFIFCFT